MRELNLEKARLERLDDVLAFVDGILEELGCPMKIQMQMDVAVEELYVNIARYAYAPGTGPTTIRVESKEGPVISITFISRGVPFDPLAKPDPDITLPAEERQIGGLGIFMVKKSMDDLHYEYRDGKNVLTMTKLI